MKRFSPLAILVLFWLSAASWAADTGSLLRIAELREKPFNDATVITKLPAKSNVTITQRKGAWAQVQTTDKQTGWVKVLNIISAAGTKSSVDLAEMNKVLKTGSSGREATTGVKGLTDETLKKAKPNPAEVNYLETLGVKKAEAQEYGQDNRLLSQKIQFLPE